MPARAFTLTCRLALATALMMFLLIVIGSVVRTTGSGLACPDWPLCEGRWIPRLEFHVLIEWLHRALALFVSLLLFALVASIFARRVVRARLGGLGALAVMLLLAQIVLGALTVWKLLHPSVVSSHLGVALLLFATILTIALVAGRAADEAQGLAPAFERPPLALFLLATATALTWAQAVLGGVVGTNHAGTACPGFPDCNGQWLPPLDTLAGIHMLHRWGAGALTAVSIAAYTATRGAGDPAARAAAGMALGLVLGQSVLGVCNVLLGTPVWVSALHLATATAILGMLVTATFRVAALPARGPILVPVGAR